MNDNQIKAILEAALLASDRALNVRALKSVFDEKDAPTTAEVKQQLQVLQDECEGRGVELVEVASGYRYQVRSEQAPHVARLWDERAPRYTRALLETLALIAYRQPITRSEIEAVRGVSVSSNIVHSLLERNWVRIIGHKEVPGRPALFATTAEFLDYFKLKTLDELPTLDEIADLDKMNPELQLVASDDDAEADSSSSESDHAELAPVIDETVSETRH